MTGTSRSSARTALVAVTCLFALALPAAADWMGEFFPLDYPYRWFYENVDDPTDSFATAVFDQLVYEGQPAVRFGESIHDHTIAGNDGQVITLMARMAGGVLYDFEPNVILGEFDDGSRFTICANVDCDTSMIRVWDALDPALRAIYEIDPVWTDLILIASYDTDYAANFHNGIVASNLPPGVVPPSGAVTGVQWIERGIGQVADRDVDAESGGLEKYYVLVDHGVPSDVPSSASLRIVLEPNVPNPFNPRTTVTFTLAADGRAAVGVFDLSGRRICDLADREFSAGRHALVWNGFDAAGRSMPSGVYVVRLVAENGTVAQKVTLAR